MFEKLTSFKLDNLSAFSDTCSSVLKRIKFASRGNVDRRDKRTSHITVKVSDGKVKEEA